MDKYQLAVEHFERKEFLKAQQILLELLKADESDFNIWNFLGIINLNICSFEEAIYFFNKVIEYYDSHTEAHYNLGLCHQALHNYREAVFHYEKAISLNNLHADALNNLGAVLVKLNRYEEAEERYKAALKLQPDNQNVLNNMGNLKFETGNYNEAESYYKSAIAKDNSNLDFYYNLGNCYLKLRNYNSAIELYEKVLVMNSNHAEALNNLGVIYTKLKQYEKAEAAYKKIISLSPGNSEAVFNLGCCYQNKNDFDHAIELYKKAFEISPETKGALINIGNILNRQGKLSESKEYYNKALLNDVNKAITFTNLGVAKLEQSSFDEAIEFFNLALEANPEQAETHYNKSHALLLNGNFKEGFDEYEWRIKRKDFILKELKKPFLSNQSVEGKRILVHDEQGLGDSIQFVRYLAPLKKAGAYVIYECDSRLLSIFHNLPFIDEIYFRNQLSEDEIDYDYHIPLLSLPKYFNTALETIPCEVPYIKADEALSGEWKKVIGIHPLYKVGIVWAGNPKHTGDKKRSCPLNEFSPIFSVEGIRIYSLQMNFGLEQIQECKLPLIDLAPYINSFADTAAAIDNLDLIITVDTSTAHLAGAMGKKAWLIIPHLPDWRWLLDRDDSPWYPSMKIFRQDTPGSWAAVFSKITVQLQIEIEQKKTIYSLNTQDTADTIYLGLSKGDNYGWGICSKYLKYELSRLVPIINIDENRELLQQKKISGKVFHALTDINFSSLYPIKGNKNIGYTFFENELNEASIKNGKEFDLLLAGSKWCRDKMADARMENTEVLLQGIDPEIFYPSQEKRDSNLFVIFSGGKFEYRKGQDLVLKAVKILQEKYEDIILINAWYNFWPASIISLNNSKHINFEMKGDNWQEFMANIYRINEMDAKRIFTLPLVQNKMLRELYLKTDLGVFPNRCEGGTNLVLMEYMACGKPAAASFNSGHKDILTDDNSIKLTEMKECKLYKSSKLISDWQEPDLDELISKIEFAYLNRSFIKDIGIQAGEDLKQYTWENSAKTLFSLLSAL